MHFPFGEVLKKAWKTTFFNMRLWWLGLLAGGGMSSVGNFDPTQLVSDKNGDVASFFEQIQKIPSGVWIVIGILIALLIFALFCISIICQSALTRGVDLASKGEKTKLWPLIKFGAQKFPKLLLFVFITFALLAPVIVLMMMGAIAGNTLIFVLGLLVTIVWGITITLFLFYTTYFINLRNEKVLSAMSKSVDLFKKHWVTTVVGFFVVMGLTMVYMMAMILAVVVLIIPVAIFVGLAAVLSKLLALVLGAIAVIILFVAAMGVGAGFTTFMFSFYVELFNRLESAK